MGDLAVLGVVIDPSGAESGAHRAQVAALNMSATYMQVSQTINVANANMATSHGSAGAAVEKAGSQMGEAVRRLTEFALAAAGVRSAVDLMSQSIGAANQFEQMTFRLTTLTGSLATARREMDLLQTMANRTPYTLPQMSEAAATVHLFDPALQGSQAMERELTVLADAAATAVRPIGDVAYQYERLKSAVAHGTPIGEAAESLQHMGILLPQTVIQLRNADAWGQSAAQKVAILEAGLSRTSGATERANRLYETQRSTLSDTWQQIERVFGSPVMDSLKPSLVMFTDELHDNVLPLAKQVGDQIGHWIDQLNGAQKAGQLSLGVANVTGNIFGSAQRYLNGSGETGVSADLTASIQNFAKIVGYSGDLLREDFKLVYVGLTDAGDKFFASVQASGDYLENKFVNMLAGMKIFGVSPVPSKSYSDYYDQELRFIHKQDGIDEDSYSRQATAVNQTFAKLMDSINGTGDSLKRLREEVGRTVEQFQEGYDRALGRGQLLGTAATGYYSGGYGGYGGSAVDAGNFTNTMATVFGRNWGGGIDTNDERQFIAKYGYTEGMYRAHHGAYTDPNTGSAYDLTQATGVALPNRVAPGSVVAVKNGDSVTIVPVIDYGPSAYQVSRGYGLDATPDVLRAVGAKPGDQVGYQVFGSMAAAQSAMGEMLKQGYQQSMTVRQAAAVSPLESAMNQTGALHFSPDSGAVKTYLDTLTQLQFGLLHVDDITHKTQMGTAEYTQRLMDAQDKLAKNVSTYGSLEAALAAGQGQIVHTGDAFQELALKINRATVEQAKYAEEHANMQRLVNLGVASPGQSLAFGATSWAHDQGNADQQYAKLMGGSLDALTNDTANFFDTWRSGMQSGAQSFKQFTSSVFGDIGKLIERMLILRAVQSLVGLIPGGGIASSAIGSVGSAAGGAASFGTRHTGGMVDYGGASTTVNPLAFLGARRFHDGGMLGLGYDEVPIVALRGERVLNRAETAAYNRGGGSGPAVHLEVNYHAGQGTTQSQSGGGSTQATTLGKRLREAVLPILHEEANRDGGIIDKRVRRR